MAPKIFKKKQTKVTEAEADSTTVASADIVKIFVQAPRDISWKLDINGTVLSGEKHIGKNTAYIMLIHIDAETLTNSTVCVNEGEAPMGYAGAIPQV